MSAQFGGRAVRNRDVWHDGPVFRTDPPVRTAGRRVLVAVSVVIALAACVLVGTFVTGQLTGTAHASHDEGPTGADYVDITSVPRSAPPPKPIAGAATGSFTEQCGTDADGRHRNPDNVVAAPREPGAAHHVHDYAGNLSTDAFSTDASLAAAGTTCTDGDRSTFYWPVVRLLGEQGADAHAVGGGADGNLGRIITASSAVIKFVGSPVGNVVPMPEFLRVGAGDPKALTDGHAAEAAPKWTCTGYTDRVTRLYPLCPAGSDVLRVFDFPSCWNGTTLDSPTHTTHIVSAASNGTCPHGTFPVPQLTVTLTYHVPAGQMYAIDSFPEDLRNPVTDHVNFIDVMSDALQNKIVKCVNENRHC
jgi:hypothetical protein